MSITVERLKQLATELSIVSKQLEEENTTAVVSFQSTRDSKDGGKKTAFNSFEVTLGKGGSTNFEVEKATKDIV